jgi:hypothetical protein
MDSGGMFYSMYSKDMSIVKESMKIGAWLKLNFRLFGDEEVMKTHKDTGQLSLSRR